MSKKKLATEGPKPPNMDALFDRIQEKLSEGDRMELVENFRAERELWNAKEAEKENKK